MQPLARIVLPVDFSERSVAAAQHARTLAARFASELLVIHVLTPPQYEVGALEIGGSMLAELYKGRAGRVAADLSAFVTANLEGMNARPVVLEGDPAAEIVGLARQERADLIIMPTHGYGPFRRFILGSNTAKVLHDADCPVWTGVHLEQAPAAPASLTNILCAVDLGPQSSKALSWASTMASALGARLTVMHSTPCPEAPGEPEWRAKAKQAAEKELLRLEQSVNVEAETLIATGEPAKAICATASQVHADVLVIGRGSAAGVFGRLRTNAYAIIRQSPCPVVSV